MSLGVQFVITCPFRVVGSRRVLKQARPPSVASRPGKRHREHLAEDWAETSMIRRPSRLWPLARGLLVDCLALQLNVTNLPKHEQPLLKECDFNATYS